MRHYRKLVRELKKRYGPFSVRRVRLPRGFAGDCFDPVSSGFVIRIDRSLEEQAAMDSLIHEVAHMLSWDEYCAGIDHGPKWARKHRLCYKVYERVCRDGDS